MASFLSSSSNLIQFSSLLSIVVLLATLAATPIKCQEQLTVESRQQKDNDDLTDTIKYLEKLDKYFSQIARPRFGRSEYKQSNGRQPSSLLLSRMAAAALANEPGLNLMTNPDIRYNPLLLDLVSGGERLPATSVQRF